VTQAGPAMAGRTCLVTGATSGIGKVTAAGLARLGADLVLGRVSKARVSREMLRSWDEAT
jgi:NAD(P)-dependent dehydrogenase (short-subunit alcohol dehydrogenase family)